MLPAVIDCEDMFIFFCTLPKHVRANDYTIIIEHWTSHKNRATYNNTFAVKMVFGSLCYLSFILTIYMTFLWAMVPVGLCACSGHIPERTYLRKCHYEVSTQSTSSITAHDPPTFADTNAAQYMFRTTCAKMTWKMIWRLMSYVWN